MSTVTKDDILKGFDRLSITGERVLIHSSLSSFGHVKGGAETVIRAVLEGFNTVMMPAFCWDSNTAPPEDDRPVGNGCDYAYYANWNKPSKPFIVEEAGIEKSMGVICREFLSVPGVCRSDHAWHSWAACGDKAQTLTENHSWNTTNLPVERLSDMGGLVVLMGTDLRSCTAIHVAEERAGRRPFIRWAVDRQGKVRRVSASGCGKGFDKMMPYFGDLFVETYVGKCRMLAARLGTFIEKTVSIIRSDPEITRCSPTCIRCSDSISQGIASVSERNA